MSLRAGVLLTLAPLLLAACASPGGGGRSTPVVSVQPDAGASSYGLFLAGEAAATRGDSAGAEALFARAAATPGSDASVAAERVFAAALLAGDLDRAVQAAPAPGSADPNAVGMGALVLGVQAMAADHGKAALADLGRAEGAPGTAAAAGLLKPIAAAMAGDAEGSISLPVIRNQPVSDYFARLDQGELYERARRWDEAETSYRALLAHGDPGGSASLQLGLLLERRGRRSEALAIYDAALARSPEIQDLMAARTRAAAGKPPPAPATLKRMAAEALMAPASVAAARKDNDGALAFLRLALRLDPTRDQAWIMLGDALAAEGDEGGAREAWQRPRPGSAEYEAAREKLAWSYQSQGDKTQALAVARATEAADRSSEEARVTLADLLRADERYEESAKVLDSVIASRKTAADWRLLYMRAVDNESLGRWPEAERDLEAALKLRPDDPDLLNFLGYSWIDRGQRLTEALAMVQKAVDLDPQSGAIVDSLGWAYYRLGRYPEAVEKLETAVALEAGDADVNNHLGDAYWRVGRRLEARFQWDRVLTLDPTPKLRAEVEAKLKNGLDGPPAPARVAVETPPAA